MAVHPSRQDGRDRVHIVMRNGKRLAGVVVFGLGRIQPQATEPRVEHVTDIVFVGGDKSALVVGGAFDHSAFQSGSRHGN